MAFSSKQENEYESQLKQIAGEVDSYIVKTDGALKRFREQIKPLAQRCKTYREAVDKRKKELLDHWERVKKNPKLQDKNMKPSEELEWDRFYLGDLRSFDSNPENEMPAKDAPAVMAKIEKGLERDKKCQQEYPEDSVNYRIHQSEIEKQQQYLEDIHSEFDKLSSVEKKIAWIKTPPKTAPNKPYYKFKWWRYLDLSDEEVFGCWRPPLIPLPEDPLGILKPVEPECQRNQTRKELPDARNAQEEYERYYIFLSSVHDNYLEGVEKITEGIWLDNLPVRVLCCLDKGHGDKIAFLKAALERVCQSNHKTGKKKEQEIGDGGNTYIITDSHVSLGDEAQHAGRDIIMRKPKEEKGIWGFIAKVGIVLAIVVSLMTIFGPFKGCIRKDKPVIEQSVLPNLPGNSVDVNDVVFETQPTANEIIAEIERLPVYEQKMAAENYKGRMFKWILRFESLVHEKDGMVFVVCETSPVRGKVSFNINADAKENLKIKKIKKGKFLDVSGEIENILVSREPWIKLKDVQLGFFD